MTGEYFTLNNSGNIVIDGMQKIGNNEKENQPLQEQKLENYLQNGQYIPQTISSLDHKQLQKFNQNESFLKKELKNTNFKSNREHNFQKVNDHMDDNNQLVNTFNTECPLSSERFFQNTCSSHNYQKIFIPVILEKTSNNSSIKPGSQIVDLYKIESLEIQNDIFSVYSGFSLYQESKNEPVTIKIYEPSNHGYLGMKEITNYLHLYEFNLSFHQSGICKMRDFFYYRICISDFEHSQQIETSYTCNFDNFEYGDLRYQAPEIILGIEYTNKSDVWSLGCIMYELLTGETLFKTQDKKEIIFIIKKVFEDEEGGLNYEGSILNNKYIESFQTSVFLDQNNISRDMQLSSSSSSTATKKIHELNEKILEIKQNFNLLRESSLLYDFLRYLLSPNPEQRPSIEEALQHVWIQDKQ